MQRVGGAGGRGAAGRGRRVTGCSKKGRGGTAVALGVQRGGGTGMWGAQPNRHPTPVAILMGGIKSG